MKSAPPLSVPSSPLLSKVEVEALRSLEQKWTKRYSDFGEVWDSLPRCGIAQCSKQWDAYHAARSRHDVVSSRECELGAEELGATYALRDLAHEGFLERQQRDLFFAIFKWADSQGANIAHLRPMGPAACLSCVGPQTLVEKIVAFEPGSTVLSAWHQETLGRLAPLLDRKARYRIRGHAEPDEAPDILALSRKRAEAVRNLLVAEKARSQWTIVAFGDVLPIVRAPNDFNRRVDFEPV